MLLVCATREVSTTRQKQRDEFATRNVERAEYADPLKRSLAFIDWGSSDLRRLVWVALALVSFTLAAATSAQAEKRIALVIGNGAYVKASNLLNPGNDAKAIAEMLRAARLDEVVV
jgi:caspase domain-containing protein